MDLVLVKALNWEQWQHSDFPYHWASFEEAAPLHQNPCSERENRAQEVAATTEACREGSSSRQRQSQDHQMMTWSTFAPGSSFPHLVALLRLSTTSWRSFIPFICQFLTCLSSQLECKSNPGKDAWDAPPKKPTLSGHFTGAAASCRWCIPALIPWATLSPFLPHTGAERTVWADDFQVSR